MLNDNQIPTTDGALTIRPAVEADLDALRTLAALDSARALLGTVLVAEADGAIQAAYSVEERRAVADPFRPTAGLVALLETRARLLELHDVAPQRARRLRRLRPVTARP